MSVRHDRRFRRRGGVTLILASALAMQAIPFVWLASIDRQCSYEFCSDCWQEWDVSRYRVFGRSLYTSTRNTYQSPVGKVAEVLGRPCPHRPREVVYTNTYLGLVYLSGEPQGGMRSGATGRWYDDAMDRAMKAWMKDEPKLPNEYYKRVIVEHDDEYIRAFFRELGSRAEAERAKTGKSP